MKPLSHSVFFALNDNSAGAVTGLLEACRKHLTNHPGELSFAVGTLCSELDRSVNVRDFDVALYIVFKDKAAHDTYQTSDRHVQFVEENKSNFKGNRVFDCYLEEAAAS